MRPALLGTLALAWALQAPLSPTPAVAQGQPPVQKESSTFQPVPEAIEKLQGEAWAFYSQGDRQRALAMQQEGMAWGFHSRGDRQKALAMQQEVMAWVKGNLPELHPFRADALTYQGIYLSGMGQHSEALPPALEAEKIYRELAKTNPAFLPYLAMALVTLGIHYSNLGQHSEALPPTLEALKITREMAKTNPAYLNYLAASLAELGVRYSALGQHSEALRPAQEAARIYRELARSNPAFLDSLGTSLTILGNSYSELGQRSESLPPFLEAVRIYRELAKSNPSFLPDLAQSLLFLGNVYSKLGQHSGALPPSLEALKITRELAKSNPSFLPDLAQSLLFLGNVYSKLGQRSDALPPTLEAEKIYRELAKTNPAYLNYLAASLAMLGDSYSELDPYSDSLPPTLEAVKIRRELARTNPAFLPDLAESLLWLGLRYSGLGYAPCLYCEKNTHSRVRYSGLGQPTDALPPTLEAIRIYRELARTNPAFLPHLAGALDSLGSRYRKLDQRAKALPCTLEALKIRRELSKANPAFLPDLAMALNNLGVFYSELEKPSEALPLLEEAVRLYTRLVASYPPDFQEHLQRARNNLEDLKRQQDLARGNQPIAPDDRSYLNLSDNDTPLRRSVVRLWPTFSGKTSGIGPLLGTGFVVRRQGDRAWIATARHVVLDPNTNAPPTELEAELYSGTLPANILPARLTVVLPTAAQSDASSGDDLIVLEIRGLPADITALPLANDPPPDVLKVVGHPDNKPWLVVSAKLVKDLFDPAGKMFPLRGELSDGASGAPVFNSEGRVVGLVRSRQQLEVGYVNYAYRTAEIQAKMVQTVPAGNGSRSAP